MKLFSQFDGNKSLVVVSMAVILLIVLYPEHYSPKLSDREQAQKTQVILHSGLWSTTMGYKWTL